MSVCLSISDLPTFLVSIWGLLLSLVYILKQWFSSAKTYYDDALEKAVFAWIANKKKDEELDRSDKIDVIIKDYETANGEICKRDNITLIVGTILIGSSFLILGNIAGAKSSQSVGIYSLASVGLFSIWLLVLHDTAKHLNAITYGRMRAVEQALTNSFKDGDDALSYSFGIHSYVHEKTEGQTVWWLRLRRTFWAIVLFLLSLAWLLLSVSANIT